MFDPPSRFSRSEPLFGATKRFVEKKLANCSTTPPAFLHSELSGAGPLSRRGRARPNVRRRTFEPPGAVATTPRTPATRRCRGHSAACHRLRRISRRGLGPDGTGPLTPRRWLKPGAAAAQGRAARRAWGRRGRVDGRALPAPLDSDSDGDLWPRPQRRCRTTATAAAVWRRGLSLDGLRPVRRPPGPATQQVGPALLQTAGAAANPVLARFAC